MITLSWPPTVNHYYTVARGRKILSAKGRAYKDRAWLEILEQERPEMLLGRVSLFILAYPPDRRKRDIDNLLKPLLDAMSGLLYKDDSQIVDLRIQRFKVSKPGRVEIMVSGEKG